MRGLSADLKGRVSALYATAFGIYLIESGRAKAGDIVLIGRDFRESSPAIAESCTAALASLGFKVVDCGPVPTPALALYGLELGAASLMITGSHIPANRNGIKFYRPDGEIDKSDEEAITQLAAKLDAGFDTPAPAPVADDHLRTCLATFIARNSNVLTAGALAGCRIGVYQHSTVARDVLADLLAFYGADVVTLGRSDSFVPVDTEAVSSETLGLLKGWATTLQLDAIVSADGDGDRPLLTDEAGVPIRGDLLGLIAANFLYATTVVTPVTSNSGIEAAGDFKTVRTRVGSPFVIAAMNEAKSIGADRVIGFEANGGLLTGSDFLVNGHRLAALPTRDCFIPILAALSFAASQARPLSAIALEFKLPFAAADRLENFALDVSACLMAYLRGPPKNLAQFLSPIGLPSKTSDIDGLRVTLADGRIIHFRPSGNAPEMRCYVEAKDEQDAASLLKAGLARVQIWAEQNCLSSLQCKEKR